MKKIAKLTAIMLSLTILTGTTAVSGAAKSVEKCVYLGGEPFGVRFYNDGVMIVELEDFYSEGRYVCPAKDAGLKTGDIVKRINGEQVCTNEDVQHKLMSCGGTDIEFEIEREGKKLCKKVTPHKNTAGAFLLGAWVRDSCAGIGTVTYYDPEQSYFAALGHGICDTDTNALMPLGSAEVTRAQISSVTKSTPGKAGSLNGYFTDEILGELTKNTPCGVYGTTNDNNFQNKAKIEIADNDCIKTGGATVYTTIDGGLSHPYSAEITRICSLGRESNENFVIKVTDNELLEKCGGIVQGMSGSPIVQDGRLVGAVTHVFLNNTIEGYGVTAQNMVSNYDE